MRRLGIVLFVSSAVAFGCSDDDSADPSSGAGRGGRTSSGGNAGSGATAGTGMSGNAGSGTGACMGFGGTGAGGSGGSDPGGAGGAGTGGGGASGTGAASGTGGANGSAGTSGSGGASGTGGSGGRGGTAGSAGSGGRGGTAGTNGTSGSGGTGGSGGACQVPAIPAEHRQTIDLTWTEMTGGFEGRTGARPRGASIANFRNTILDQLFASDRTLRYCVRWDSSTTATTQVRDQIAAALQRNINLWFSKLTGYDCFPLTQPVTVKVTGWAVRNRNLLEWSDDSVPVFVNDIRENAPQCAEACGRFFNRQANYQYPNCPGGFDRHYDMSIWLTDGFSGGVGGDWGQRLATNTFVNALGGTNIIVIHEMGHGFGFPDYYNWSVWAPGVASPNSVMVAGRSSTVTDWDSWMIRHLWSQLKSRWP